MSLTTGCLAPPGSPLLLQRLVGKVESLETMMGELFARRLPSLEGKLEGLRELLAHRRKEHYLVEEIAELTGRSAYTVRRWIAERKLNAIRLRDGGPRGKLLVPRAELERLIASGKGCQVPDTVID
jgi:excisionase family DNA binding protein